MQKKLLTALLYRYACKKVTAKQVHKVLKHLGYRMNLKSDWAANVATVTDLETNRQITIEV